jgi:hypothetical protein
MTRKEKSGHSEIIQTFQSRNPERGEHYAKIYASTSADNNDATITQTGSGDHYMRLKFLYG